MTLSHTVALVMVKKCVEFEDNSFNRMDVIGKVKVFHDNDDDDVAYATADDTGVMTIPQLIS